MTYDRWSGFGDPNASSLSSALNAAPALVNQPSSAIAAAGQANPEQAAQIVAQGQNADGLNQALAGAPQKSSGGWQGMLERGVGDVAKATHLGTAFTYLNKPLQEVQRDYRFIHEVYTKHGFFNGALATLGVVAPAAVGGAFGGPVGAEIGADAGAALTRFALGSTVDRDADAASKTAHISPGRDLANLLGQHDTNHGFGRILSGIGDSTFDLMMDPTIAAGKATAAARTGQLADRGLQSVREGAFNQYLRKLSPSLKLASPDAVQAAYDGHAGVRRAMQEFADSDAGQILARNPHLGGPMAGALGAVHTPEQALDLFKTATQTGDAGINTVAVNANAAARFVNRYGIPLDSVQDVDDLARTSPQAEQDMQQMVGKRPAQIAERFPELAPLASDLARAKDVSEIQDTLRLSAHAAEMAKQINDGFLPSRTLMRVKMSQQAERTIDWGATNDAAGNQVGINRFGRIVRSFTGYKPYGVDAKTQEIAGKSFDPDDPNAGKIVYQSLRMGLGGTAARMWTAKYLAAGSNLALKRGIWKQGQLEAMKAFGLPDSHRLMQDLSDALDEPIHGAWTAEGGGKYEHGLVQGDKVNEFTSVDPQSAVATHTAGSILHEDQKGRFSVPDWNEWVDAKRNLTNYGRVYGKFDDVATPVIKKAFKPLALVNAGFGMRIALAELIPQYAREGFYKTTQRQITAAAARAGYKLGENEDSHIWQAAAQSLGGLSKAMGASEEEREFAIRLAMDGDGQIVKAMARTGGNAAYSSSVPVERAKTDLHALMSRQQAFKMISPGHDAYRGFWALGLGRSAARVQDRQIAQDLLDHEAANPGALAQVKGSGVLPAEAVERESARIRGASTYRGGEEIPENVRKAYAQESKVVARYRGQDPAEFAAARVDSLLGKTVGADNTVHTGLLRKVSDGDSFDVGTLDNVDPKTAPQFIVGQDVDGYLPTNPFSRVIEAGYRRLVDPIVNNLSRNPVYMTAVKRQYDVLAKGADSLVGLGHLTDDEAFQMAKSRAVVDILPQIHNTEMRSQFSEIAKNFMPFYFAQEQAFRRAATGAGYAPHLIREYQLINNTLHNPAFVHTDDQGNRSVVLPGVGELGKGINDVLGHLGIPMVGGLPITYTGNIQSLKTIMPAAEMPSTSPLVSIGSDVIQHFFPEADPALQKLQGRGFGQPILNQVLPNVFLREEYRALTGNESDSEIASSMASAMAAAAYHGQLPPEDDPAAQQQFIDKLKNDARSASMLKGVVSLFSPVSPRPILEDMGFRDEFYTLLKKNKNNYAKTLLQFEKEHGSNAVVYTIAKTKSTSGARAPVSQQAIDFLNTHSKSLSDFPLAAPFLVPQSGMGGSEEVLHQEQLTMGLRQQQTPEQLLKSMYVTAGDQRYFMQRKNYLEQLASDTGDSKALDTLKSAVGDDTSGVDSQQLESDANKTAAGSNTVALWRQWSDLFQTAHPLWHDNFTSTTRTDRAVGAVKELYQMAESKSLPDSPQTKPVTALTSDYFTMLSQVQAAAGHSHAAVAQRQAAAAQWTTLLGQVAQKDPTLQNVIQQVFNRLPTDTSALRQFSDLGTGGVTV